MQACTDNSIECPTGCPLAFRRFPATAAALLGALVLAGSSLVQAKDTAADTTPTQVTFGGSAYYPPFHFFNQQGAADGFDVDVFDLIAQDNGWIADYRLDDWQLIQQALSRGDVDIVPMFVSAERNASFLLSSPIHVEYHLLFGPQTSLSYAGLASLSDERIAAEGGAYATAELLKTHPHITVVDASSEAEALSLVDRGAADLALLPSEIGRYSLRIRGLDHLTALSPPLLPVTYAFAVTPTRPELLTAVNTGIERLQRQGQLETLRKYWLFDEPTNARERALLVASWTLPLLLMLLAAGFLLQRYYRLQLEEMRAHLTERLRSSHSAAEKPSAPEPAASATTDRKRFLHQLEYEITVARHQHGKRGLALVNLLNLDTVQDAFDDAAGDEMLERLTASIPALWADRYAQITPTVLGFLVNDVKDIDNTLRELIVRCSQPVRLRDLDIHPQLSAGFAIYPDHADNGADLLHKAKMAMNCASRSGQCLVSYSPSMKPDPRRIQVISDLRHALAQRQLQWAVQPQFDVAAGCVYGAELLVRWHHPQHGWLPPSDFITWAEEAGLINQISDQVIDETASLFNLMPRTSDKFCLSINLSAHDLGNDALVETLIHKIRGQKSRRLTVEVTETALMHNKKSALRNIDRLKMADFHVALDDYGTGYASLEYLQAFNFDEIKIDRRFINNITSVERNRKLTRACIELGHHLGANVVAEGVEDAETASMLVDMGCDVLQGYFIGRPQLLGDFANIRRSWQQVAI